MYYRVQQRADIPWITVKSRLFGLPPGTVVMLRTDHGPEPATVMQLAPISLCRHHSPQTVMELISIAGRKESEAFAALPAEEAAAFAICSRLVTKRSLVMKLVRVEKFYGGGKMIFYFTAENRVDFRGLVKDLVKEFRTRIEMRQIGVRNETRMLGGVGICGREFCCSGHLDSFSSVSIKMAKEQDLPLNPNKISGVCNRLLCCLANEYGIYRKERRKMPAPGRRILLDDEQYLVRRQSVLRGTVIAENPAGEEVVLDRSQWERAQPVKSASRPPGAEGDGRRHNRGRGRGGQRKQRRQSNGTTKKQG